MEAMHEKDGEQAALWNGPGGNSWVDLQDVLDRVLEPLQDVLVEAVFEDRPRTVLDVGCGTGGTTVAMARRLGGAGTCTGIDISEPMVAAAKRRAEREGVPARFLQADAQRHRFEPARFDAIASRFGVMFFDDFVEAFANLRSAVTADGTLRFIAWRTADENPFMTTAERAAAPLVAIPPRDPGGPGQFGLADPALGRSVLEDAGWGGIDLQPIDVACSFPEQDLVRYVTNLGPLGRALADCDAPTRARIVEAVRPAFDSFVVGADVHFTAACWLVGARPDRHR
jgi:SAM-dependent methyltransferase